MQVSTGTQYTESKTSLADRQLPGGGGPRQLLEQEATLPTRAASHLEMTAPPSAVPRGRGRETPGQVLVLSTCATQRTPPWDTGLPSTTRPSGLRLISIPLALCPFPDSLGVSPWISWFDPFKEKALCQPNRDEY